MKRNNYLYLSLIVSLISLSLSIYFTRYFYDGHHFGLVYDASNQLLNGKLPFNDVFLYYGFPIAFINKLILILFGNKLINIVIFNSLLYSASLFLFFIISSFFINKKYSFYIVVSIFFLHPWPSAPWSNYLFFFLLIVSILALIKLKKHKYILFGSLLSLASFIREETTYLFILFILFLIFLSFLDKKKNFKETLNFKNIFLIAIFFLIIKFFYFIYIYSNNLEDYFNLHNNLPIIFLEARNYTFDYIFFRFLKYIISISIIDFIFNPYKIIFLLSLIINSAFIINFMFKNIKNKSLLLKDFYLCCISFLSCSLYSLSLHEIHIFRLICGSSLGLITFLYVIDKIQIKKVKFYLVISFLIICISSLSPFYKSNGNLIYKTKLEISSTSKTNVQFLKGFKFKTDVANNLNDIDKIFFNLSKKCKIKYFASLQKDLYYKIIGDQYFENIQYFPWYKNSYKEDVFIKYFDKDLHSKVQKKINEKNIIIITSSDMLEKFVINNKNINIKDYSSKILEYSYDQKIKVVLAPSKCNDYFL